MLAIHKIIWVHGAFTLNRYYTEWEAGASSASQVCVFLFKFPYQHGLSLD